MGLEDSWDEVEVRHLRGHKTAQLTGMCVQRLLSETAES